MERLIRIAFVNKTDNTFLQLFRYLFVGGAAFVVDMGALILLTELFHVHYLVSAAAAFLLGLTANFLMSIAWVFPKSKVAGRSTEFAVFAAVGAVGLVLNEAVIWGCTDVLLLHYTVSKVISTGIAFFWNFLARKFLLYK